MKKMFLLALVCTALTRLCAQQTPLRTYIDDPALSPHEHSLDFTHLRLELWPEPAAGKITGKVTHYFRSLRPAVDSFFLDAIQMTVKSISLNGQPVSYRADSAGITVLPAKPLVWNEADSLTVEYSATPRKGLYFIGWKDPLSLSRKQVWSQGEAVDNRHWIPLYDEPNDKLSSELIVHFDSTYKVLSNGQLVSVTPNPDGANTWHYSMSHPHAAYLIMLGIGKYAIKETHSASGVPEHLYYYPEWKDRVEPTYQHSTAMIDFFENETGLKYPWESYSQLPVQDYMYGAMENTTATVYGDFYLVDQRGLLDRTYIPVNAHELAHQWFGDYVTARSNADGWLQESFATYYNQLFEREVFGDDHFEWERRSAGNAALEASHHDVLGVANSESGGVRIYGKGAFVLDMLKYVVGGRDPYNKAIQYYLQKNPYRNVDTHDLQIAFEESTGMDLQWFFDEWLYRGGEPDFHVDLTSAPDQVQLVVSQHPLPGGVTGYKDGLFRMPVVIELHYTDGAILRQTRWIEKATEIIKIPNPDRRPLGFVLFDAGSRILKSVAFPRSYEMLAAQAIGAGALLDRYDAVVALRSTPMIKKIDLLTRLFHQEKFFAIRNEVLTQIAADSATLLIKEALHDPDVAVRKAALATIDPHSARAVRYIPQLESLLKDSSYDIIELALQKLADARPTGLRDYLRITKGLAGNNSRNIQVRWLELAYITYGDKSYADELVKLTSQSYEFRTRVNAMAALRRLDYFSDPLTAYLIDAILSPNTRLAGPAGDLLAYFYAQDKHKNVIGNYVRHAQWADWQKLVLERFTR